MTTQIATTQDRKSILLAMASRYEMDPAAFEQTIRATCGCANASREDFAAFLLVAHQHQLNPACREIYAFPKKGGGIQPIVSVDGWIKLANNHPQYDGIEFLDRLDDSGRLVAVTARVYRKDRTHPEEVTEYMAECVQNTDPWKRWPARMLRHKARIQAYRAAFGLSGIVDPDEADRMRPQMNVAVNVHQARAQVARIAHTVEPEDDGTEHFDAQEIQAEAHANG